MQPRHFAPLHAALCAGALLVTMAACSPVAASDTPGATASATAPRLHPVSGLAIVPLTITSGKVVRTFQVEVAASALEQERGLMWRRSMGADEGMIFPMSPPRSASFWMKNTVMGLDIIFIGADHKVLNIAANAVPYDETPLMSAGDTAAVLELNAGRAGQLGIAQGDTVNW